MQPQPSRRASRASDSHGPVAPTRATVENVCAIPRDGHTSAGGSGAVREQLTQVVGTLEQPVAGGAHRLDIQPHGVVVAERSKRVAGERQRDRAEVRWERTGGLEGPSKCLTVTSRERFEAPRRGVNPVRRDRRHGAEVEHGDPAVSQDEHVIRIDVRMHESKRALRTEREPHERCARAIPTLTGVAQRHAADPFADRDARVREPHHRRRHDDIGVAPERALKAPLDARLVLEVKLVEHPLSDLAQQRRRIDRRERGGERGKQALQH